MNIFADDRVVLTLDAGGTNFVFSAIQKGEAISTPIQKKSNGDNLELCIQTIKEGFKEVMAEIQQKAVAISFAFPGPADYPNGIIGDLFNLPGFRGGVPLKAILEEEFKLPVFINNDGDLYAYGEALGGILPEINASLAAAGSPKQYKNLVGLTLGTGFGGGLVYNNELFIGDNSMAAEVWLFSNRKNTDVNAEDLVGTRAVQRVYAKEAGIEFPNDLMPKDIFDIACGIKKGNMEAALKAYEETGAALGDIITNLLTFTDGIVVIGGGITGAKDLYMPAVMNEIKSKFHPSYADELPRLVQSVFNLDHDDELRAFCGNYATKVDVPGTDKSVTYDPTPRVAVATTNIGASKAISLGAYAYALKSI